MRSRLADLLDARREEIIRRWTEHVARFHATEPHSRSDLEDHLPQFLVSLGHNLREGRRERARDYQSSSPVKNQGAQHGLQRFQIGFNLEAMVREYGELREILDDLFEQSEVLPSREEERILNQCLSTAVAEAVSTYTASQRLRLEEGRMTLDAVENGDAFFILDAEWRVLRVNRTQERLSQTPREQSLGRCFWDVFPVTTDPTKQYWPQYHRVMRERVAVAFEEYYAPLDLWTEVTAYPEEEGGIIVFFRDVTAKKHLEAALKRSEERYELAEAESARARRFELLREQQILGLAKAAAAIHGATSREEMLRALTQHARALVEAHQAVASITENQEWAQAITAVSLSDKYAPWRTYAGKTDGSGIYAWVCQTHHPLRMTQAELEAHPRWRAFGDHRREHPPLRGWLAVPLVGRDGRNLGLVQLSDKADGSDFSIDDEALVVQLAQYTSGALENERLASEHQKAQQRARIAVDATQLGTWDLDPLTGTLIWDARCKQLFGLPPDAPVDYPSFLSGLHPKDRERVDRTVQRALDFQSGGEYRVEYRTVGVRDGVERWLDARGRAFFDDTHRAVRFTGTVLDITERKLLEAEHVALLAREQAARSEAENANRLKDEFIATVSHELRTPLTAILGWVQILRSGQLPEERRVRALETVERNAHAQSQLVEDLLDISRIMSGKLLLEVESVDLGAVVEAALESIRPAAVAKGLRLQPALDSIASVMGDSTRLQQIVWNLLSNAVKFTPKGGRVQVLVERRDSSVEIVVADSGKGIPADFLPHVFERFRQAEGSVARKYGGLGLGLSIVKHLVELHGGTIDVFSDGEDQGATFTVRLPMAVVRRKEPPRVLPEGQLDLKCPPALEGLRVLLVDDEADTREFLRTLLEGCHARVETAASATEGLRALIQTRPHLLISDIGMPGEDGFSFIRKVRALPASEGGRIPAVALTAYARAEDRTRALLAGFKAHVPKPIARSELLAVILSLAPSPEERA